MTDRIIEKLNELETTESVRILHAVESGSRAWGFASPDSDYDVRFIYVRPKEFYLRLDKTRNVIEKQTDAPLDVNGWDLQKALRLLHSSNPTLFEWNNSPIVYKTTDEWAAVRKEIDGYFIAKAGLYHYLSAASGNYREYLKGDTVRLKKYFYVVRPLLACKWILSRDSPPPMRFTDLVDAVLEDEMKPIVAGLLRLKTAAPEIGEGRRIDKLNEYIEANLVLLKNTVDSLPSKEKVGWNRLNELFLSIV